MEPSHSGLVHHLGKVAGSKGSREFESLRFRRLKYKSQRYIFLSEIAGYQKVDRDLSNPLLGSAERARGGLEPAVIPAPEHRERSRLHDWRGRNGRGVDGHSTSCVSDHAVSVHEHDPNPKFLTSVASAGQRCPRREIFSLRTLLMAVRHRHTTLLSFILPKRRTPPSRGSVFKL